MDRLFLSSRTNFSKEGDNMSHRSTTKGKTLNRVAAIAAAALIFTCSSLAYVSIARDKSVAGSGERDGVTLTVGAVMHEDSSEATGNATFHNRNTNSKLSIDVLRVTINLTDQLATVTGEITRSTGSFATSFPVGSRVRFQVEDEGEGSDNIPDGFTMPSLVDGGSDPATPPRADGGILPASERGNLQVRGLGK
jgi:hypothetical protein